MPASPELADRGRDIRIIEVLHKIKSKHFSQSDRHIRISRKIKINLKCVQNRQHPRIDRSQLCQRFLQHPVYRRRKGISKQHFFRQSVGKALDSIRHPLRRTLPVPNLFADIVILDDRSRDELRKERNIKRQMKDIFLRLNRPPRRKAPETCRRIFRPEEQSRGKKVYVRRPQSGLTENLQSRLRS